MKILKSDLASILTIAGIIAICILTSIRPAFAAHATSGANSYYTYAEVIAAEPIIRQTVETIPHKECRSVRPRRVIRRNHRRSNALPTLLGSLVGGVIGHQFGGGRGKKALTIAGALTGASIASNAAHSQEYEPADQVITQRCTVTEEVREVESIEGYFVTYRYQGREFTRTTVDHPGSRIRLRVKVNPVIDSIASNNY
jgi:uncharacterized protein YcfJ